MYNKENTVQ